MNGLDRIYRRLNAIETLAQRVLERLSSGGELPDTHSVEWTVDETTSWHSTHHAGMDCHVCPRDQSDLVDDAPDAPWTWEVFGPQGIQVRGGAASAQVARQCALRCVEACTVISACRRGHLNVRLVESESGLPPGLDGPFTYGQGLFHVKDASGNDYVWGAENPRAAIDAAWAKFRRTHGSGVVPEPGQGTRHRE